MARVQGHSTRGLLTVQRPFPRGLLAGIALLPEVPQSLPPPHFLRGGVGGTLGKLAGEGWESPLRGNPWDTHCLAAPSAGKFWHPSVLPFLSVFCRV